MINDLQYLADVNEFILGFYTQQMYLQYRGSLEFNLICALQSDIDDHSICG